METSSRLDGLDVQSRGCTTSNELLETSPHVRAWQEIHKIIILENRYDTYKLSSLSGSSNIPPNNNHVIVMKSPISYLWCDHDDCTYDTKLENSNLFRLGSKWCTLGHNVVVLQLYGDPFSRSDMPYLSPNLGQNWKQEYLTYSRGLDEFIWSCCSELNHSLQLVFFLDCLSFEMYFSWYVC